MDTTRAVLVLSNSFEEYICQETEASNVWGLQCNNQKDDIKAVIPIKYESYIGNWSQQLV